MLRAKRLFPFRLFDVDQRQTATWGLDLCALFVVCGVLYFFCLGAHGLIDPDEGRYSQIAWGMIRSHDFISPRVNGVLFLEKPILYYWLQVIAIKCFGLSAWSLRFFPAITALCSVSMTYLAGRVLFCRSTGILAACLLALMPVFFGAGHYANMDMEVSTFITCALLCFLMSLQRQGKSGASLIMLGAYVFTALAVLTKGLIGLAFPMMIIGLWILLFNQWRVLLRMRLGSGFALFLILVLPWFVLVTKENPGFLTYYFYDQQVVRYLSHQFNNGQPVWFYLPIILGGSLPWSFFLVQSLVYHCRRLTKAYAARLNTGFLLLWALLVVCFFSGAHSKLVGYILPVFAPMALLIANYMVAGVSSRFKGIGLGLMSYIVFLVFAIFGGAWYAFHSTDVNVVGYRQAGLCLLTVLLLGGLMACVFWLKHRPRQVVLSLLAASFTALMVFAATVPSLGTRTMKPLVDAAKPYLPYAKDIAVLGDYFTSLPLYLDRKITVVNDALNPNDLSHRDDWVGMFNRGMRQDPHTDYTWMIHRHAFWQRWKSQHMLVFTNDGQLPAFRDQHIAFWLVGCDRGRLLLANYRLQSPPNVFVGRGCASLAALHTQT